MRPSDRIRALEIAITQLGGEVVDPWPYAAKMAASPAAAMDDFLKASGVEHFSGSEVLTPSSQGVAVATSLGWEQGQMHPPVWAWQSAACLCLIAELVRRRASAPVSCRNWFRSWPTNSRVSSSGPASDHPHACAVDLDIIGGDDVKARDEMRSMYRSPLGAALSMSLGFYPASPQTIHVGIMSPLGQRTWGGV